MSPFRSSRKFLKFRDGETPFLMSYINEFEFQRTLQSTCPGLSASYMARRIEGAFAVELSARCLVFPTTVQSKCYRSFRLLARHTSGGKASNLGSSRMNSSPMNNPPTAAP